MEHYQEKWMCKICGHTVIVDIFSAGTPHQSIEAVTCIKCAGNIMEPGEIRNLKLKSA